MLLEACVFKRDVLKCVRIRLWQKSLRLRLWPVRRDDSSRVLIGAAGMSRSDWRRRKCVRSDWPERV